MNANFQHPQPARIARLVRRAGFTLVEILVVIAIIGVLVGLIVPAVNVAYRSVKKKAIALEVVTIADAINKYQAKYGDYPPDGSDAGVLTRHLRKVFPQIAASELTILTAGSNASTGMAGAVMDPPEALVFFLGGFSDDPIHPFTGPGGPFAPSPANSTAPYQYNIDRNSPLFEFKQAQLSLEVMNDPGSGAPITVSNDERELGLAMPSSFPGDLLPIYRPSGNQAPFVYFDSRTYATSGGFNRYYASSIGCARPYKSAAVNTTVTFTPTTGDRFYRYAEEKTFQVISAGLDDNYGGIYLPSALAIPTFFSFPSGAQIDISVAPAAQSGGTRYAEVSGEASLQLDNATNFSEGVLEDSLEN